MIAVGRKCSGFIFTELFKLNLIYMLLFKKIITTVSEMIDNWLPMFK